MFKVCIITLNYNGKKDTLELLESLKKLRTTNYELRTIVLDNASSDGSVSAIRKEFPQVDILQTGQNLGFGEGLNKGFEYGLVWGADYFLVINNDSKIADSQLLEKLIKVTEKDPQIGMVAPKILFEKGFEFHKDRYKEDDLGKVIWYGGGKFDWDNIASVHRGMDEIDKGQYNKEEETNFITGACFLIKREVLEKAGGFNGEYFLYFEDADLNKRVIDAGYKLYYCGVTFIYHKVSRSTGIGSILTDYYHSRNRLIFGFKFGRIRTKFALLREAFKLLIIGRIPQRQGVIDYFLGIKGGRIELMDNNKELEYPLKLSIGIVNYNTADLVKKLLQSIFNKDSGFDEKEMEVIVLDNGSDDNCKEVLKEFLPKINRGTISRGEIKYLQNLENEGFSKGYNKTIRYSLGEYYLMLNSDIEVLKGGLSELIKAENEFKGEAVLGGKLVFPDGSNQDSAFNLPTIMGAFKEYFLGQKGSYFMYLPKGDEVRKVDGLVMACFMISKKILGRVGLLDERTFIFFEDIEYSRRLKQFNIPLYFVPLAKFIHHHGGSTKRIGQEKAYSLLKQSSKHYHGTLYYFLLSFILKIGQKLGRIKTPISRWTQEE